VQEDGDVLFHQRKRPKGMPNWARYGTARVCAGIHPEERPIGRTPKLGAEPRVWTARMLAALETGVKDGKSAAFAGRGFSACEMPMSSSPVLSQVKPSTGEPDAGDPHVRFGGRGDRNQSVLPTPIRALRLQRLPWNPRVRGADGLTS